jgi:hypothetical protein
MFEGSNTLEAWKRVAPTFADADRIAVRTGLSDRGTAADASKWPPLSENDSLLLNFSDGVNVSVEFRFRDGVNESLGVNDPLAEKSEVAAPLSDWLKPGLPE